MTLLELKRGEKAIIKNINLEQNVVNYLISIGMYPGNEIEFERNAPLGDPQQYLVAGNYISIRKSEAVKIEVEK